MKVDFMIIGAMKSGTSTLAAALSRHPEISFCSKKEPHYFSLGDNNWKKNLDQYHSLFEKREGVIYGEGSTTYSMLPDHNQEIWNRLYEYNPNLKFIYIMRNPVERCISQYKHMYLRRYIKLPIEDAIFKVATIVNNSRYYMQVSPYIEKFGIDNVLLIDFDDLQLNQSELSSKICSFLSIGDFEFNFEPENVTFGGEGKMDSRLNYPPKLLKFLGERISKDKSKKIWHWLRSLTKIQLKVDVELNLEYKRILLRMLELDIQKIENLMGERKDKWRSLK